jgi:choline dehydrogenase-like flavoprotein
MRIAQETNLWGERLTQRLEADFGRSIAIAAETEHQPHPESRVTLHPFEVNVFGDPIPVIHFHVSDYDRETRRRAAETIRTILGATEFEKITMANWNTPGRANHHMGTCRMGVDPATSVVDPQLRIHGVRNAFVLGSAVFPSGGAAQPTLTIVALAFRLAEHLIAGRGAA